MYLEKETDIYTIRHGWMDRWIEEGT